MSFWRWFSWFSILEHTTAQILYCDHLVSCLRFNNMHSSREPDSMPLGPIVNEMSRAELSQASLRELRGVRGRHSAGFAVNQSSRTTRQVQDDKKRRTDDCSTLPGDTPLHATEPSRDLNTNDITFTRKPSAATLPRCRVAALPLRRTFYSSAMSHAARMLRSATRGQL